jgi:indole-3-glycerol phosphate synthase
MNILEQIVANKRREVELAKQNVSTGDLEKRALFAKPCLSLKSVLHSADFPRIISEFKRQSPSKGVINGAVKPEVVTKGYTEAGAAALSVLTDQVYFGGNFEDFLAARAANPGIPMLRKDFIVDEYQLFEAKSIGADLVLLIAACLSPAEVGMLSAKARLLGMEVLLEVHNKEELEATLCDTIDIVGVNNRNLKTFETSVDISLALSDDIPGSFAKISESGLKDAETIHKLYDAGYKGFLIGETFMKTEAPAEALKRLQEELIGSKSK